MSSVLPKVNSALSLVASSFALCAMAALPAAADGAKKVADRSTKDTHAARHAMSVAPKRGPDVSAQNQGSVVVTHERGVRVWRPTLPAPTEVVYAPSYTRSAAGFDQGNGNNFNGGFNNRFGSFGGGVPSLGFGSGTGLGGLGGQFIGGQFGGGQFSGAAVGAPLRGLKQNVNVKMVPGMMVRPMQPRDPMGKPYPGRQFAGPGGQGPHSIIIRGDFGPKMGGPRMGGPRMGFGPRGMGQNMGGPKMMRSGGMGQHFGGPRMGGPRMGMRAGGRMGGKGGRH